MRRPDVNELLRDIIAEASVALRRKNFEYNVERIHRRVHVIEQRIKRFEESRYWSEIDKAFEKTKDEV